MLSRNNYQEKVRRTNNKRDKYSIRKLSIGVASTLIGISFLGFKAHTVHASTTNVANEVAANQTQNTPDNKDASNNEVKVSQATTDQVAAKAAAEKSQATNNVEQPHTNAAPDDSSTWKIGNDSKNYDGNSITKIDSKNFKLKDENGKELNTTSVNNDSFEWVNKDGQPLVDAPKNVGTYNVKLTDSATKKLQKDNPTLTKDPGIVASYTIKQGQATATLRGYDSKQADGKSITTDDLNKDGKIYVDLNVPGSTANKYQLKDGDYSWYDNNNNALTNAPTEVGTYHAKLTDQGKKNITDYIIKDLGVGTGKETIDGVETIVPNVKITFIDSSSLTNTADSSSANATFTIYDAKSSQAAGKAPNGAVWTPAGWTNANPDYVVKNANVTLYPAGKKNFDSKTALSGDSLSKPIFFGTDITATIDKNDLKIGNKILLATITATNDYTTDPNSQLPLSVASTENGRAVKAAGTNKIIGRIIVSKLNNGEIDYWLDVTDTDTYGQDVTINNLTDYEAGYITSSTDFSDLAKLSKNGKQLQTNDTITQTISTVNNTYTQQYKIGKIVNGVKNIGANPTTWASGSKPAMSANYLNPALGSLTKTDLQNIATKGTEVTANDYYKVFSIQGQNIDFDNLTTWERVEISPVDGGQIKGESSDLVKDNNGKLVRLDKNSKKAIRLDDNLNAADLIAQTPDGQSAYSVHDDGSVTVVVKVKANDVKLSKDEIASYVKSSQYYNMQAGRKDSVIQNTQNFYDRIGDQSLRTAIMISAGLKDIDSNDGWANIIDITPNSTRATGLPNNGIRYQHGQASADGGVFRSVNISYTDDKGKNSSEAHTVLVDDDKGVTKTYSITIPSGHKFDPNKNKNLTNLRQDTDGSWIFDYTYNKNEKLNKPVNIVLDEIPHHNINYTVIDDDVTDKTKSTLTTGTYLGTYYMLDGDSTTVYVNKGNKIVEATKDAEDAYKGILSRYQDLGYVISNNTGIDWAGVKSNDYNLTIHLEHGTTTVTSTDNNWPQGMSDSDKAALSKTITRKITVSGLPSIISSETQTAQFTREVTVDNVTKKITKTGDWKLVNNGWKDYSVDKDNVLQGFHIDSVKVGNTDYANVTESKDKKITGVAGVTPTADSQDIEVHITYIGDPIKLSYKFEDQDENNKEINYKPAKPIDGTLFKEHNWTTLPKELTDKGYELVSGQQYYFGVAGNQSTVVYVKHGHENVTDTKTVTRTINITDPHTKETTTTIQKVFFTRTGDLDKVLNKTEYSNWTTDGNSWTAVTVPMVDGYTPTQVVTAKDVNVDTPDETINIVYTANAQTTHVVYQDANGKAIKTDTVSGQTDQTVNTNSLLPAGWKIADSSTVKAIPSTINFKGASTLDTVITVDHATIVVKSGEKAPTGKVPGNPDKNYALMDALTKTTTRTINITNPDKTTQTINQGVDFTRIATFDEVTGEVTYSDWTLATDSNKKAGSWNAYTVSTIAGYTPSQVSVDAVTVDGTTANSTINITYTANEQTTHVVYKDAAGHVIKTDEINGKTDQTVNTNASLPAGWKISDSSDVKSIPTTIIFKGASTPDTVITVDHIHRTIQSTAPVKSGDKTLSGQDIKGAHEADLTQTITRTVNITDPHTKQTTTTTQTAHLTRTGDLDEVTGHVTYGDWTIDADSWGEVDVQKVAGYTPSQSKVDAVTVKDGQKDVVVSISYTANAGHQIINYVDSEGKTQGSQTVNGTTDENVKVTPTLPAGWVLSKDSGMPTDVTIKPTDKAITVKIEHGSREIQPTDPVKDGEKTPTDKVINGGYESDLNQTITRTINITDPHTKQTTTTTQTAKLTRIGRIDLVTGEVTYGAWTTDNSNWGEVDVPKVAGYTPSQASVDAVTVTNGQKAVTINITYTANDQTTHIVYKDANDDVIKTDKVTGKTDETVDTNSSLPAGWKISDGSEVPTTITFRGASTPDTIITVDHIHRTIQSTTPVKSADKTLSGQDIKGAHEADLNQTITRTINVTDPRTKQTTTTTQTAHLTRTGDLDEVTGHVTYNGWSQDEWAAVDVPTVDGYTPNTANVDKVIVTDGQKDAIVNITYTANDQTTHVVYQDADGNTVKTDTVNGKTDQTVDTKASLPAGWKISDSSDVKSVPATITFKGASTADTVITIEHAHRAIQPTAPINAGDKTLSGKEINGAQASDLNKTITRTINITDPHTGKSSQTQTVKLYRDASYDEVTGEVTYDDWTTGSWQEFKDIPTVPGYTPSQLSVGAVKVTDGQKDLTVDITYTPNAQTTHIIYQDATGKTIKTDEVTGKTDQTVTTNSSLPTGWILADGQSYVPGKITFKGEKTADITIKIKHGTTVVPNTDPIEENGKTVTGKVINGAHEDDLNETITRTITIHVPGEKAQVITQKAQLHRDAKIDNVTGEVTYGTWSTDDNSWSEVDVSKIDGYTPSQSKVDAVKVTNGQQNQSIDVTYTANQQSVTIKFVDDDNGQQVVNSIVKSGVTDETIDDLGLSVPIHYQLANGQELQKSYKFNAADNQQITVHLTEKKDQVTDPTQLNKTISRKITISVPGKQSTVINQTATFSRTGEYNEVTGETTYTAWNLVNNGLTEEKVPTIAGYTASEAAVDGIENQKLTADTQLKDITINYTANQQTGKIIYVDADNKEVGHTDLTGKTDQEIKITPEVPAGYDLVSDQAIPENVTATAKGIPTITVYVKHHMIDVKPSDKISGNPDKKPGDGTPNTDVILHKSITRTINVKDPHSGLKTTKLTLNFERTATIDDVTGEVFYGDWFASLYSKDGFDDFEIPEVSGYTSEISNGTANDLKGMKLTQDQINNWTDQTINVGYTAKDQSMIITYIDENGKPIDGGSFTVSGKTDQTVATNAKIPAGWILVNGQNDAPDEITFKGESSAHLVIAVKHAKVKVTPDAPKTTDEVLPHNNQKHYPSGVDHDDLNKKVTRKIILQLPNGQTETVLQTAWFTRDAEVDEVSGDINYGAWMLNLNEMAEYQVPTFNGYHANLEKVAGETPTVDGQYADILISYVPDSVPAPVKPADNGNGDDNNNSTNVNNDNNQNNVDTDNQSQNAAETNSDAADTQREKAFAPQAKDEISTVAPQNSQDDPVWADKKKANFAVPAAKKLLKTKGDAQQNKLNGGEKAAPLHNADKPTAMVKPMVNKEKPRGKVLAYEPKHTSNAKTANTSKSKQSTNTLPQTGAKKDNNSWLGILLSTLGLSALFVNRKKKKD